MHAWPVSNIEHLCCLHTLHAPSQHVHKHDACAHAQAAKLAAFLSGLKGFDKLSGAALNSLVHHGIGVELYQGQVLFRSGDAAQDFYIVAQGQVRALLHLCMLLHQHLLAVFLLSLLQQWW